MKERPILFSAPMVCAILDGRKTQTRRIVKPQPLDGLTLPMDGKAKLPGWWFKGRGGVRCVLDERESTKQAVAALCPYGEPGDRLWVRETFEDPADFCPWHQTSVLGAPCWCSDRSKVNYRATSDNGDDNRRWRPSIHMPRWASRLLVDVTAIRVERLQDISEDDAEAEGGWAGYHYPADAPRGPTGVPLPGVLQVRRFSTAWDRINGERAPWSSNPWVWVVEFKRAES